MEKLCDLPDSLICVICDEFVLRSLMLNHIAEHVGYFRHRCQNCCFKTAYFHSIVEHELDTGHTLIQNVTHRYLDRLCMIIYSDCVCKTKIGEDAMFACNFYSPSSQLMQSKLSNNETQKCESSRTNLLTNNVKIKLFQDKNLNGGFLAIGNKKFESVNVSTKQHSNRKKSNKVNTSSVMNAESSKNDCLSKIDKKRKKCKSLNELDMLSLRKLNSMDESFVTSGEMADFSRQINRGQPTVSCIKCKLIVPNDYRSHKEHVIKRHLEDCSEVNERDAFISKFIQVCFPGAISINDYQCCICGHEMRSTSGRKSHISREHLYIWLNCPQKTCSASFLTVDRLSEHLKLVHTTSNSNSLNDEEHHEFEKCKRKYHNKLRVLLARCFPFPLPTSISSVYVEDIISSSHNVSEKQNFLLPRTLDDTTSEQEQLQINEKKKTCQSFYISMDQILVNNCQKQLNTKVVSSLNNKSKSLSSNKSCNQVLNASHDKDTQPLSRAVSNAKPDKRKKQIIVEILSSDDDDKINLASFSKPEVRNFKNKCSSDDDSSSSDDQAKDKRRKRIAKLVDEINHIESKRSLVDGFSLQNKNGRIQSNCDIILNTSSDDSDLNDNLSNEIAKRQKLKLSTFTKPTYLNTNTNSKIIDVSSTNSSNKQIISDVSSNVQIKKIGVDRVFC